jgi:peptide/nickel transport system substrate-binding protein
MKLTGFPLLVASSLLLTTVASAAMRPHYGGTLHVAMQVAPQSLDPADITRSDWIESRNLLRLMFDTLVSLDEQGKLEPALAISWQSESGNQRWQFFLRRGVTFQDGSPVTTDAVAASLRKTNPTWKVFSEGEAVVIERDSPTPNLSSELALPRNSIAKREGGKITGTGPFTIAQWDAGKKLILTARDDYWGGRAFLDTIEIELGKSLREQTISFGLGKTQVIEVAPEQAHRAATEAVRVESSAPVELIALVFGPDSKSAEYAKQRQVLALSIDRDLLNTVVLQGGGEPAGGLLPNWMTGYEFVFPTALNLAQAREVRSEIPHTTSWTLGYDLADPTARVIAERISLNARDAGLGLQITSSSTADLKLVRLSLVSSNPEIALSELATALGLPQPKFSSGSIDDLYTAENNLLQSQLVIPLLHMPTAWALSTTVNNWKTNRDGSWPLPRVWLAAEKP